MVQGDRPRKALARMATHPRFATSIIRASKLGDAPLAASVTASALIDQELVLGQESDLAVGVSNILEGGPGTSDGRKLLRFATQVTEESRRAVSVALSGLLAARVVSDRVGAALLPGFIDLVV